MIVCCYGIFFLMKTSCVIKRYVTLVIEYLNEKRFKAVKFWALKRIPFHMKHETYFASVFFLLFCSAVQWENNEKQQL